MITIRIGKACLFLCAGREKRKRRKAACAFGWHRGCWEVFELGRTTSVRACFLFLKSFYKVDKPGKLTHLRRMKLTRVNELPRFDLSLG